LQEHQRAAWPFELTRTLRAQGMVLRRDKQKTAGKAALEQALDILERLEALLWAESTKAKRDRVELRRAASMDASGITAAQAKVAELVAARRTNREVASELFISPRPWRRICRGSTASLESPLEANSPNSWLARADRPIPRQSAEGRCPARPSQQSRWSEGPVTSRRSAIPIVELCVLRPLCG
jgi:ElaB/YqjD/DUF883 family membrane-anchored ribosome-binding protein